MTNNLSSDAPVTAGSLNLTSFPRIRLPSGPVQLFTGLTMAIELAVNLPMSCLLTYLVLSRPGLRKSVNYILLNGMLAETTLVLQWVFLNGYYMFVSENETICFLASYIMLTVSLAVYPSHALLAINRFVALYYDVACERIFSTRRTILMLAAFWVVGASLACFCLPYMRYDGIHMCGLDHRGVPNERLLVCTSVALADAFITYAVIIYCNTRVSRKLTEHKKRMEKSNFQSANMDNGNFENIKRLLNFQCIVPLFLVVPHQIVRVMNNIEDDPWLGRGSITMVYAYSCMSPYILVAFLKPFRMAVKGFMGLSENKKISPALATISSSNPS